MPISPTLKKRIALEILIFFATLALSFIIAFISDLDYSYEKRKQATGFIWCLWVLVYIGRLCFYLIKWAIKTLKEK